MARVGRPSIGNYHHIPFGDLDALVQQWASEHRTTFNEAVRVLVRDGLQVWPGERVLEGIDRGSPGLLDEGGMLHEHAEEYRRAIHDAFATTRSSASPNAHDVHVAFVRPYEEPITGFMRFAVVVESSATRTSWDYPGKDTAEKRYEHEVRELARIDVLFENTDVDDIPNLASTGEGEDE